MTTIDDLPETVYVSKRSKDAYHLKDCPRLPDRRSPRRAAIVVAWDTYRPCRYCIDGLALNSENHGGDAMPLPDGGSTDG